MIRSLLLFAGGALLSASAGWYGVPKLLYREAAQPVAFTHKTHTVGQSMGCDDCHSTGADGAFAGIPKLDKCSTCHAAPMGQTKAEKDFIDLYVTPAKEPQWLVYSRQPDNAWFPHSPHTARAKLACAECHLDHGKSAAAPLWRVNRVSGYATTVLRMDGCVDCHQRRGLAHSCLDCHK
jgi:hypothetical protein